MKRRLIWLCVMVLCVALIVIAGASRAYADSGTYGGISWDLTDGVLTLGVEGETQTLTNNASRSYINWPWYSSRTSITSVVTTGNLVLQGSLSGMFYNCSSLMSLDLSRFDTSNVTNMYQMFAGCGKLTSLDLSGFNTSKVTSMGNMFDGCISLTSLDLSGFNTLNVTSMYRMFCNCVSLTSLNLFGWNTSNVTNMRYMFAGCSGLTSLDVSNFNTSNVTSMEQMFSGCKSLTSLDVSNFNTSNVTNMGYMFQRCSGLTSLDLSGFNTSQVTSMSYMFDECSSLTSLDLSSFNTSNVTNMSHMFIHCGSLTSLDVSSFNTSNVTDMEYMFYNCSSLTSLNISNFNTSKVTTMRAMFYGCSGLTSLDLSGFNTSNVTIMGMMFYECSGLTSLNVSGFNTSNVTSMSEMFRGCSNITSLDFSGWNTSNVTDMAYMFDECSNLTSLDLSGFNTGKVVDMPGMFYECSNLTSLDLSNWNTSNVTSMNSMFYNCSNLTSLDISGFSTNRVNSMKYMFDGCSKLAVISLGDKYKTTSSRTILLPTPPSSLNGVSYTRKWIREDRTYGPFTPYELMSNYNNETMPGKWIWEPVPTDYTLRFSSASYPGAVGEMAQVITSATADYQLAANQYGLFGFVFDHWDDGKGHTYADQAIIPANTYNAGDVITLNLVMTPRDTSVTMQDGAFEFSIQGGETALFDNMPANTVYQVFEQTPNGWNLIAQSDASGTVVPLVTSQAAFGNEYNPNKVVVRIAGTKLMSNGPADADAFTFMLYEDDTLVDIVKNKDGGLIEFSPITYTASGVHHYIVREAAGSDPGVIYDTHQEEITVTVESDSEGNLLCDIQTDTDGILFQNDQKPGYLKLAKKSSAGHEDSEAGFVFDIQFTHPDGRPYDLAVSTLDYVDSEDVTWDLPDVGAPEKVKYMLTVAYQRLNIDGTVKSEETSSYEYYAGDVFELNDLGDSLYKYQTTAGLAVMRVGNVFKGVMSNGDNRVEIRYEPLRAATIRRGRWNANVNDMDSSSSSPLRTASSFRQNTLYTSVNDLPLGAVRIDDEATACSVYFWKDGDNAYWWSDAETVYLPADASRMFCYCNSLTSLDLSGFDTSNVTDMRQMFRDCSSLASVDVSGWNTSNVTSMFYMFYNCSSLMSLNLSGFNTSNVTDMQFMFSGCSSLASLDLSGWNTSNVTSIREMFRDCSSLASVDVSNLNTSKVTSMYCMFTGCSSLTSLDLSGFDTSNVTNMYYMFSSCIGLTSLNVSGWDTSKATDMSGMFYKCSGLTSLDLSGFNTSSVTGMGYMFQGCSGLISLDLSKFDTSNVTTVREMFEDCSSLTSLDLSGFDMSNVTNMNRMYYNCSSLKEVTLGENNVFKGKGSTKTTLLTPPLYKDGVTYTQKWILEDGTAGPFTPAELRDNYDSTMQGKWIWEVSPPIATIDKSKWEANVNDANSSSTRPLRSATTFSRNEDYASVEDLPTGAKKIDNGQTACSIYFWMDGTDAYWWSDAETVYLPSNANYMFFRCSNIENINIAGWDTSKVTQMLYMFYYCNKLMSLDLSSFDTSHVTSMSDMFTGCSSLHSVKLGENNPFKGSGTTATSLPTPPSSKDGVTYTGKWIREDGAFGPFSPAQLRDNYTSEMQGKWIWEVQQ